MLCLVNARNIDRLRGFNSAHDGDTMHKTNSIVMQRAEISDLRGSSES